MVDKDFDFFWTYKYWKKQMFYYHLKLWHDAVQRDQRRIADEERKMKAGLIK